MVFSIVGESGFTSLPRLSVLLFSLIVALGSGTNYVYSAYAPQLGERLGLSHTQLNVIGIAGNIGVLSSAPVWGRIVDSRGPQPLLAGGFFLLLTGYSGIRYLYDAGEPVSMSPLLDFKYMLLILFSYMTGVGGTAGIFSGVNSTAKTFPDSARATTTGLVLSGFGLSAFLFSVIAEHAYPGDTSSLLFLLTVGTTFPMILGVLFIRPIPLSNPRLPLKQVDSDPESITSVGAGSNVDFHQSVDSHTPLLAADQVLDSHDYQSINVTRPTPSHNLSSALSEEYSDSSVDVRQTVRSRQQDGSYIIHEGEPNTYGVNLWMNAEFLLLFSIFSLLAGAGLMYINNVGSISQKLYATQSPEYDEKVAARWQAKQVTVISLMNCAGRIVFGFLSDVARHRLQLPRSYCLVIDSFIFLGSQLLIVATEDVKQLWLASAVLGFAYGGIFGLMPTLCIHFFGMGHFSENFGFLSLAPMIAGYIFSVMFGRNLDAHEESPNNLGRLWMAMLSPISPHQCMEGRKCYVDALNLTIGACCLGIVLSVWTAVRDRRAMLASINRRQGQVESN